MRNERCQRCGKETLITIMSMFNEDIICPDCKDAETKHPDYQRARNVEIKQIRSGNYNFEGIGKPDDL